ncbi:MAG: hypothetical protein ACYDA1_01240 [Vulcanimicrobiaceae bacterium]
MITEPDPTPEVVARQAKTRRFYGMCFAVFAVVYLVLGIHLISTITNSWYGYVHVGTAVLFSWGAWRYLKQAATA